MTFIRIDTMLVLSCNLFLLSACSTTDPRIDRNYDQLRENRIDMYAVEQQLDASEREIPEWVSSYLDAWDCGDHFCTIGRAEINADEASPFTCLEVSRLKAKANLVSVIQTDIASKIMVGSDSFKVNQQKLKQIVMEGLETRNLSNIKIGENYYRKLLKHASNVPQAYYQCFSVAKVTKSHLQNLITREANRLLDRSSSKTFDQQLQHEWDRFFKISPNADTAQIRFDDVEVRTSMTASLVGGDLESIRENLLRVARAFLKLPYQLGGDLSDGSIDCSNYVKTVYSAFGFQLPRTSPEQFDDPRGTPIDAELLPGDLVFFHGSLRPQDQPSHVGMYVGDGKFINANGNANARKVQIDDLTSAYWQNKYLGARRFVTETNFVPALASSH